MRRTVLLAPALVLAVACAGPPEPSAPQPGTPGPSRPDEVQDGMSFTGWWHDAFRGRKPVESMTNLADTGAGWVAIVTTWYQGTIASTDIHPRTTRRPTRGSCA